MQTHSSQPSPLLVFAVAGRIGSGCSFVCDSLTHALASYGYSVEKIKATRVLERDSDKFKNEGERIAELQTRGSALRKDVDSSELAKKCIREIIAPHITKNGGFSRRQAYIIDSLKHRDEIAFLRKLFRQAFYLVGVVASDAKREERLRERKHLTPEEIRSLSEIDAGKTSHATQETVKTVTLADYFFKNDYATRNDMNAEADRLMRRIFDVGIDTPREDEYGMHVAYQASLRSACLSRQVGAALFSSSGVLLSTGHNDVPKFGGGLYGMDPPGRDRVSEDKRCWTLGGKCYNDIEKRSLAEEVCNELVEKRLLKVEQTSDAVDAMLHSRVDQLIEFSRAVHAEMEAIISIARTATVGISGSTLYSTTYPCHNCAKHIIDAGISRVVYREPYEKSLARRLHIDAITDTSNQADGRMVTFEAYGGVGPQRYEEFFRKRQPRKDDSGSYVDRDRNRHTQLPSCVSEADFVQNRLDEFLEGSSGHASHEHQKHVLSAFQSMNVAP